MRRWLILLHRYLGIGLGLVFVMWFVTGIAMIYARDMPRLTPSARLARRSAIDFSRIALSPTEAAQRAGLDRPSRVTLLTALGRPAYRFGGAPPATVFADTGEALGPIDSDAARQVAAAFLDVPATSLRFDRTITEPDQWTLLERTQLPLLRFTADDAAATSLYVSPRTADIVLSTTRASRALAWISAIPHWLYFVQLRTHGALWRAVVIGLSALATLAALLGLLLAVVQRRVVYAGMLRWHYVTGAVFGVFAFTWALSGLLSMEPFFWAAGGQTGEGVPASLAGGPLDLGQFPAFDGAHWAAVLPEAAIKEVEFARIQGAPYYLVARPEGDPVLVAALSLERQREAFSTASILARVRRGEPAHVVETERLSEYDAYYYARDRDAPLPVLRLKFDDPEATWLYVDLATSRMVARFTRLRRVERWIYHGFHSLDFSFWYYRRPLWEGGMIVLLAGGALLSTLGVVLAARRVGRAFGGRRRYHSGISQHQ